ncbi:MAG TPA: O-antigen ligase family protein [Thermoleophilaceae bacterium]|nr:O-antigen ligase family protein [Thermoleophilaceae bacterium]
MRDRRQLVAALAAAAALAVPTVLAFFSGGFFDEPRLWAALVLWALVAVIAVAGPLPRPGAAGWAALGGLAVLTALTAASMAWTPIAGAAQDDYQRLLLYLAALACAVTGFSRPGAARAAEPVLAAGVAVVCAYALSARLAPDLVEHAVSDAARGRLDQPLTYWNALGILSAMGLLLAARLAGDLGRPAWLRVGAAALGPLIALSTYLTFSRGALAALAIGVVAVVLFSPSRDDARGIAVVIAAGVVAALGSELPGLGAVSDPGTGGQDAGAAMALVLVLLGAAAAALVAREAGRRPERPRPPLLSRARTGVVVAAAALGVVLVLLAGAAGEQRGGADASGADRLSTVESNRYAYWRVALDTAADRPFAGTGSGSFGVQWLRHRDVDERVDDAHSLYLETAAELGLAGLVCLGLFLGGLFVAARRALEADRALAAGPAAVLITWAVHAGIDWDWEMPAVTLVMLAAAGLLIVAGAPARARA